LSGKIEMRDGRDMEAFSVATSDGDTVSSSLSTDDSCYGRWNRWLGFDSLDATEEMFLLPVNPNVSKRVFWGIRLFAFIFFVTIQIVDATYYNFGATSAKMTQEASYLTHWTLMTVQVFYFFTLLLMIKSICGQVSYTR
jgi:hypothetical protein